jgi:hypothetical protein
MKALASRVCVLEAPQGVRNGAPQEAAARTLFEEEGPIKLSLSDARVTTLEAQNVAMAARLDSEAIKMGGVTFQSLVQDCRTWVMNNICPADFYEFYDASYYVVGAVQARTRTPRTLK